MRGKAKGIQVPKPVEDRTKCSKCGEKLESRLGGDSPSVGHERLVCVNKKCVNYDVKV